MTLQQRRCAERRANIAPEIVSLYQQGKGHKTIAKTLGHAPRIVRTVLIEAGVYTPKRPGKADASAKWSRTQGPRHLHEAMERAVKRAQLAESRSENKRLRQAISGLRSRIPKMTWMDRYNTDPQKKAVHLLRKRIRNVVKRGDKAAKTLDMLGCTRAELMAHLERQFKKGMNWKNHGSGRGKWNIDHIIPCASFDMTKHSEQRVCFHYTNLQPMWAIANIKKGDKCASHNQLRFL